MYRDLNTIAVWSSVGLETEVGISWLNNLKEDFAIKAKHQSLSYMMQNLLSIAQIMTFLV